MVGLHPWCGGGALGCSQVVGSRGVVGLHPWCGGGALSCSRVVGSQSVVGHVVEVWPLVGGLGGASALRLV